MPRLGSFSLHLNQHLFYHRPSPLFFCVAFSLATVDFLFKIKRSSSPLFSCPPGDIEDVYHLLFECFKYAVFRYNLISCAANLNLLWPVPLDAFAYSKILWSALIKYPFATKRLDPALLFLYPRLFSPFMSWLSKAYEMSKLFFPRASLFSITCVPGSGGNFWL